MLKSEVKVGQVVVLTRSRPNGQQDTVHAVVEHLTLFDRPDAPGLVNVIEACGMASTAHPEDLALAEGVTSLERCPCFPYSAGVIEPVNRVRALLRSFRDTDQGPSEEWWDAMKLYLGAHGIPLNRADFT